MKAPGSLHGQDPLSTMHTMTSLFYFKSTGLFAYSLAHKFFSLEMFILTPQVTCKRMTNDMGQSPRAISPSSGYPVSALHINTVVSPLLACGGQARRGSGSWEDSLFGPLHSGSKIGTACGKLAGVL